MARILVWHQWRAAAATARNSERGRTAGDGITSLRRYENCTGAGPSMCHALSWRWLCTKIQEWVGASVYGRQLRAGFIKLNAWYVLGIFAFASMQTAPGARFTKYLTICHKIILMSVVRSTYDNDLPCAQMSLTNIVSYRTLSQTILWLCK